MAKHHAGSSAVLSSGPAVQLRPHNFVVTCIASQKKIALVSLHFQLFSYKRTFYVLQIHFCTVPFDTFFQPDFTAFDIRG